MIVPTEIARDEALRALAYVRAAIDRTARYSTFSAMSGFIAGTAAIVGSGAFGFYAQFPGARPASGLAFLGVWSVVCGLAAVSVVVLTAAKARQRGEPVWTPIARTAFSALMGPAVAGVLASIALVHAGHFELLPGLWLTLYGCGLYVVSFFAPLFLRGLGIAYMALGLGAWLCDATLAGLWLGLGFGVLHLIFGAIVLTRYRQ